MIVSSVQDELGRKFEVLRLSVNSSCNFACTYCVSDEEVNLGIVPSHAKLNASEFIELASGLHKILNLKTVRITGGEPTMYADLPKLIMGLKRAGIPRVKLTTNGYLLKRMAAELKAMGLDSLNISLDALSPEIFFQMSRGRKIDNTLEGIDAAMECGLDLKLNCTLVRGENSNEIIPLLEFAGRKKIPIRFLELMQMGHLKGAIDSKLFPESEILSDIKSHFGELRALERKKSATANYWETQSGFVFGIIANESTPFCADCNRLRLDHRGNLYGCLSSAEGYPLLPALKSGHDITPILYQALQQKQKLKFTGSKLSMKAIGG